MKLRPCSEDGRPVSFETLMELERINNFTFRSRTKAFEPGGDPLNKKRAYGGHVYAQAVLAAAQTVPDGFVISSVTGFFILMARVENPFVYSIRTIRDGRSYCIRAVEVTQAEGEGICFTCTCSFKAEDWNPLDLQEPMKLDERYSVALAGKRPQDHPDAPGTEMPTFRNLTFRIPNPGPFPGLKTQKVDMKSYNAARAPQDRRALTLYSTIGRLTSASSAPNLHAAAHLYASDRNSLFILPNFWEIHDNYTAMASLNHTVVFHGGAEMLDTGLQGHEEQGKWFCQEAWTDRVADGRGVHHSRILDMQGRHIATTLQDGLLRLGFSEEEDLEALQEKYKTGSKI